MAYRRKHAVAKSSTFEVFRSSAATDDGSSPSSSLAAQAIRASSAYRDSSLSSAYGEQAIGSARGGSDRQEPTPLRRSILQDDGTADEGRGPGRNPLQKLSTGDGGQQPCRSPEGLQKPESPGIQKRIGVLTSSLSYISGTIGNALEEGLSRVEHRTADIIQETKKLNMRRKNGGSQMQSNANSPISPQPQAADYETQLKASRNVANAMAAKAKLLLRELKTVKADLAFAKERCAQLEEENKVLRESRHKGDHHEDDDLLTSADTVAIGDAAGEKARLAHENSVYARENRFLREIVEYHQLTMQDVVYLDEGIEEVTEVYPRYRCLRRRRRSPPLSPSPCPLPPSSAPRRRRHRSPRKAADFLYFFPLV
ncbi:unnamed protein product [Spirodela intermedia]|uniref:Uncharacterized protein n=1 Tax=Spirodela intermedia TaxID=51605 RepID=A0A7I8JPI7_SPIIN|nr:unnamed protein product [Spirodela intermedia]CAA6672030.1 unnamed protein product [Spirodela intermedia]